MSLQCFSFLSLACITLEMRKTKATDNKKWDSSKNARSKKQFLKNNHHVNSADIGIIIWFY